MRTANKRLGESVPACAFAGKFFAGSWCVAGRWASGAEGSNNTSPSALCPGRLKAVKIRVTFHSVPCLRSLTFASETKHVNAS